MSIEVYVLKPFPWSEDGYTLKYAEAHSTISVPEKLFAGLNKEGFVRRSVIGDGHVELRPFAIGERGPEAVIPLPTDGGVPPAPATINAAALANDLSGVAADALPAETAAPQPPARTAALTPEEEQAIADGAWKDLRFFAQRSIAAKLSDEPVKNGDDVRRIIEAEIARRAAAKAEAL